MLITVSSEKVHGVGRPPRGDFSLICSISHYHRRMYLCIRYAIFSFFFFLKISKHLYWTPQMSSEAQGQLLFFPDQPQQLVKPIPNGALHSSISWQDFRKTDPNISPHCTGKGRCSPLPPKDKLQCAKWVSVHCVMLGPRSNSVGLFHLSLPPTLLTPTVHACTNSPLPIRRREMSPRQTEAYSHVLGSRIPTWGRRRGRLYCRSTLTNAWFLP